MSSTHSSNKWTRPFCEQLDQRADRLYQAVRLDRPAVLLVVYRSRFIRTDAEEMLHKRLDGMGQHMVSIDAASLNEAGLMTRLCSYSDRRNTVFFVGDLRSYTQAVCEELNTQQEHFVTSRLRTVFWLTEEEMSYLVSYAPALWVLPHSAIELVELLETHQAAKLASQLVRRGLSNETLHQDTTANSRPYGAQSPHNARRAFRGSRSA